ncbi:MAG: hypothetical protein IJ518_07120 [Clostridia bacterium]|nr:hypothetical protein [Clostridia bacterium]
MEIIFEFIFSILVEGSIEVTGEKSMPLFVRILAILILSVIYFGLFGLLLFAAIKSKDAFFISCACIITGLITGAFILVIVKKMKKRK